LLATGWDELDRLKLSDPQARELGHFLERFLTYHLGKILPSRKRALDEATTD
jgi:hypothetical protein